MKIHKKVFITIFGIISCTYTFGLCASKNSYCCDSTKENSMLKEISTFADSTKENSMKNFNLDSCNKISEEVLKKINGDLLSIASNTANEYPITRVDLVAIDKNNINQLDCKNNLNFNVFEHIDPKIQLGDISNIVVAFFCRNNVENGGDQLICKKNMQILHRDYINKMVNLHAKFGQEESDSKLMEYAKNEPNKKMVVKIYKDEIKDENFLGESEEFCYYNLKVKDLFAHLKQSSKSGSPQNSKLSIFEWFNFFGTCFNNEDKLLTPVDNSPGFYKQSWDVVNFALDKTKDGVVSLNFNILPVENKIENIRTINEKVGNCRIFENIAPKPDGKSNITMAIFASNTGLKRDEKLIYSNELDLIKPLGNDNLPILGITLEHETLHDFAQLDLPKSLVIKFYNSNMFDASNPDQNVIGVFGDKFCTDEKVEVLPTPGLEDDPEHNIYITRIRDSYRTNRDNILIRSGEGFQTDQKCSCVLVYKREKDGNLSLITNLFAFDKFINKDTDLYMAIMDGSGRITRILHKDKLKTVFFDDKNKIAVLSSKIMPSNISYINSKAEDANQLMMKFYYGDFDFDPNDHSKQVLISKDLERNLMGIFSGGAYDRTFSISV